MKTRLLDFTITYAGSEQEFELMLADPQKYLSSHPTLQRAWDELLDECERQGAEIGQVDLQGVEPCEWNNINR